MKLRLQQKFCPPLVPNQERIVPAMPDDDPDSPRPLMDPCAPRKEGSSIHGYYMNQAGRNFKTDSVAATLADEDFDQRAFFEMCKQCKQNLPLVGIIEQHDETQKQALADEIRGSIRDAEANRK